MTDLAVGWKTCSVSEGCPGAAALLPHGPCIEHADEAALDAIVAGVQSGEALDLRGITVRDGRLLELLSRLPVARDGTRHVSDMLCNQAVFEDFGQLSSMTFEQSADFTGASFRKGASFRESTFVRPASFDGASFDGPTWFGSAGKDDGPAAVFKNRCHFKGARFLGLTLFDHATFGDDVAFDEALFGDQTSFRDAVFESSATFDSVSSRWREGGEIEGPSAFAISFAGAKFEQGASFDGIDFQGGAGYLMARFAGRVTWSGDIVGETDFRSCTFTGPAEFSSLNFSGTADFTGATFEETARFGGLGRPVTFAGRATFAKVWFRHILEFREVTCRKQATFVQATLEGPYRFNDSTFEGDVEFHDAILSGRPRYPFERTTFEQALSFRRVTVERARGFGPLVVNGTLSFHEAVFTEPFRMVLTAPAVVATDVQFRGGVQLWVSRADIVLDGSQFSGPSMIASSEPSDAGSQPGARIVSLRRADVGKLVVSNVDMRACRFYGAHNLDGLRIDGDINFELAPAGWRWTGRQVIAEEHEWRSRSHAGWYPQPCRIGEPPDIDYELDPPPESLEAHQIAVLYRALRKGREGARDEPGAADFYYGEMEMRRHSAPPHGSRAERAVITLYWLVSGYGMRATRALAALAITIAVFAVLLWKFGFSDARPFVDAVLFSIAGTTSLLKGTGEVALTRTGQVFEIGLRLLGPVFFGLALLSLRGRVKR